MQLINNPLGLHGMYGLCLREKGIIKQLKPYEDGIVYEIKESLENIFVICPESGGNSQAATIVCNINGKPLVAISGKDESFSFPYNYQAVFAGKKLVMVTAHTSQNYTLTELFIFEIQPQKYMVGTKHIWGGKFLPKEFLYFVNAINAVEKRLHCISCSHTHFECG